MGNPLNRKCADCVYFALAKGHLRDGFPYGRCVKTPNALLVGRDIVPDSWCGEFRGADGSTFLEDAEVRL